jgi:hypothetical protein
MTHAMFPLWRGYPFQVRLSSNENFSEIWNGECQYCQFAHAMIYLIFHWLYSVVYCNRGVGDKNINI